MALRFKCDATVAFGPATSDFLALHEGLFDKSVQFTLRKDAPLLQMLEAPADFAPGSTEPWIVDVLCALLKASDQRSVLECGAFVGATTVRLAHTLAAMGGGRVAACEIDPARAAAAQQRLEGAAPKCDWQVVADDVLKYLATVPRESIGFAWVDDDHTKEHVARELEALIPKMVPNGIVCGHDVYGSCDLQEVFAQFGGYSLDLPRLGFAGGLGLLQVRA